MSQKQDTSHLWSLGLLQERGLCSSLHTGNSNGGADGFVSRRSMLEAVSNPPQSRSRRRGAQTRAQHSLPMPPQEH